MNKFRFLGSCDLNMPTEHGIFVALFFVPFRLSCDISAKQVGIVMKWSYFKAKLSLYQSYE